MKGLIRIIILGSILIPAGLNSQTLTDSLKQRLNGQKGKERIGTLITLSQQNLYFDAKQASDYAEEALSLAKNFDDKTNIATAYYYFGFSKYRLGYYIEALDLLQKGAERWKSLNNFDQLAITRNLTAIINYYIGRYEISTKLYSQNLVYYKSQNNWIYYSKMLINLATVYSQKGNFDRALEKLLQAESYARRYASDNSYIIGNLLVNIGEAYFGNRKYDLALKNYLEALEYLYKIDNTDNIANTQMDIGLAYLEIKNFPQSIEYLKKALDNYREIKYTKGVMDVGECIIKYYKAVKRADLALEETRSLESMSISAKDTLMLAKSYSHYADIYDTLRNYKLSSTYYKKYFVLRGAIDKEENKQNFIGLQVLTDAEEKEMENIQLRQENELQKERLKSSMLILFSFSGGLILVSIFLFIIYKKEKRIRKYSLLLENKNEEIEVQNNKLKDVILAKDKFFSILAHNLKNPFWALLGLNSVLDDDNTELPESEKRKIITQMGKSLANVYRLFEDLLSWAKTQQSSIKASRESLSASRLIYNSILPYELRAKEKNIEIKVDAAEDLFFNVDKFMLETVIGNLVDNAIKFSRENGVVEVIASGGGEMGSITIKDYGMGIPEDKIEKLFRIDENISSEGTLREKGTGLGLIICKEFVKLNNGEVFVESRLDEGSAFTIKLFN